MFDRSPALSTAQVFQWENLSTLFNPSEFQSPQVQQTSSAFSIAVFLVLYLTLRPSPIRQQFWRKKKLFSTYFKLIVSNLETPCKPLLAFHQQIETNPSKFEFTFEFVPTLTLTLYAYGSGNSSIFNGKDVLYHYHWQLFLITFNQQISSKYLDCIGAIQ